MVIGEVTYNQVGDQFATIELDQIAVKGKTEAVTIFGLLVAPRCARKPTFRTSSRRTIRCLPRTAVRTSQQPNFVQGLPRDPGQSGCFYDLYDERIEDYKETPPGPDWDGVRRDQQVAHHFRRMVAAALTVRGRRLFAYRHLCEAAGRSEPCHKNLP